MKTTDEVQAFDLPYMLLSQPKKTFTRPHLMNDFRNKDTSLF